jgi:FtsX-like permease family
LERGALLGFAAAAAIAALVLIGQAIVRMIAAGAGDMPTLQSLGFTRVQKVMALSAAATGATVFGVGAGIGLAYALSGRFPIGIGRRLEPHPGLHADWFVLGLGAFVALAVALIGVTAVAAWYVWRGEGARRARSSMVATAVRNSNAPLPLALGTQLALERTPGRTSVPVRPAIIGAVVGVLGIVGALTFRTGLERGATDRALYGVQFDAGIEMEKPSDMPAGATTQVLGDPDVDTVNATTISVVAVNGRSLTLFTVDAIKGATRIVTTSGHPPTNGNEIVLAPTEADALHAHVGDLVDVGSAPHARRLTLVGIGFTPVSSHTTYDQGGWITPDGLKSVDPTNADRKYFAYAIAFRPGVNASAAIDRLNHPQDLSASPIDLPAPLGYMRNVRQVPLALGAFLVLLAIAAVGHALASMVGRRRREIAILRSLGMTRGQVRGAVAWQATTLAVVGVVVGIPLGVLVGRFIWRLVADATPLRYVPPFAAIVVAVVAPVALLVANALAAWPARRAARLRAAEILRTE